ncbi:kinase-like protein [Panus rudis PR-1116 ss-1]|nr:kinase-like protein [Panus rudis PR-1116 ss-1]
MPVTNSNNLRSLSWYSPRPQDLPTSAQSQHSLVKKQQTLYANRNGSQSTPGLVSRSFETSLDKSYLASTPNGPEQSGLSSPHKSLVREKSFEIQHVTDLHSLDPDWNDDEIDEVMVLSPKTTRHKPKVLSIIPEDVERCATVQEIIEPVDLNQFLPISTLRRDPGSSTHVCRLAHSSFLYTMKIVEKRPTSSSQMVKVRNEQAILRSMDSFDASFCTKLRWSFQDDSHLYLVTEMYAGGPPFPDDLINSDARFYATELVEAIHALHSSNLIHRDIRLSNLFLSPSGHLVLTGFQLAVNLGDTDMTPISLNLDAIDNEDAAYYRAPEVVLGWRHDCTVDIWAFGVTFYMMLTGEHPFFDIRIPMHPSIVQSQILHADLRIDPLQCMDDHANLIDLLSQCLERNAALRPTIDEVKTHPYFANTDWSNVRSAKDAGPIVPTVATEPECTFPTLSKAGPHVDGFNFGLQAAKQSISQTKISRPPPLSMKSQEKSFDIAGMSNPSSFSCTSFGELKDVTQNALLDIPSINTTGNLSNRNTVSFNSQAYDSMLTPEKSPPRGLRKYASLDFELDTVISLPNEHSNVPNITEETLADLHGIRTAPLAHMPRWSSPLKGFKFPNRPQTIASPMSPYESLVSDLDSAPPAANKLRKKAPTPRSISTPVLPLTAEVIPDLPSGVEQIGYGIGYTRKPLPPTPRNSGPPPDATASPRRSISLMPSTTRYQALLSDGFTALPRRLLRATKRVKSRNSLAKINTANGEEEEEDGMEAVMKEMYGSNWDLDLGGPAASNSTPLPSRAGATPGSAGLGFGLDSPLSRLRKQAQQRDHTDSGSSLPLSSRGRSRLFDTPLSELFPMGSTLRLVPTRANREMA